MANAIQRLVNSVLRFHVTLTDFDLDNGTTASTAIIPVFGVARNDKTTINPSTSDLQTAANLLLSTIAGSQVGRISTETLTAVASATTSTSLKSANAAHKTASVFNESTAIMYLAIGNPVIPAGNDTGRYNAQISPGGYFEIPPEKVHLAVNAAWVSANGFARVAVGT